MKFKVPKIVRKLDLAGYAPELEGVCVDVWVNPPVGVMWRLMGLGRGTHHGDTEDTEKSFREEREEGASTTSTTSTGSVSEDLTPAPSLKGRDEDVVGQERLMALAELWGWTVEEVLELVGATVGTDPRLFMWMAERTIVMVNEHRRGIKKG